MPEQKTNTDIFSLSNGCIVFTSPADISPDDVDIVLSWLDLLARKLRRIKHHASLATKPEPPDE